MTQFKKSFCYRVEHELVSLFGQNEFMLEKEPGFWLINASDSEQESDLTLLKQIQNFFWSQNNLPSHQIDHGYEAKAFKLYEQLEHIFQMIKLNKHKAGLPKIWIPETESFVSLNPSGTVINSSSGIRLLVFITDLYFETHFHFHDKLSSFPDNITFLVVIEIPERYPLLQPSIAVLYDNLYIYNNRQVLLLTHFGKKSSGNYCLSLAARSIKETTSLCIGEQWSPSLTLDFILTRTLATLREHFLHVFRLHDCLDSNFSQMTEYFFEPQVNNSAITVNSSTIFKPEYFNIYMVVIILSIFLRIILSYQPHSGLYNHPTYGDYEAHRRWKEITYYMPIQHWYSKTTKHWDIDYPHFFAYYEYLLGIVNKWLFPQSTSLTNKCYGFLTPLHKSFMRTTVLFSDLIFFYSSSYYFFCTLPDEMLALKSSASYNEKVLRRAKYLFILLTCPPFLLIDHVHFQYNCIPLGLLLWSIYFLFKGEITFASLCYLSSILFKQTFLYFLPAMLTIIIGFHIYSPVYTGWLSLSKLMLNPLHVIFYNLLEQAVVYVLFILLSLVPFAFQEQLSNYNIESSKKTFMVSFYGSVKAIISRVFPFHRGLYEDYVSNFWVAIQPLLKLNRMMLNNQISQKLVLKITFAFTLLPLIPVCYKTLRAISHEQILNIFFISSLSFYMFSMQVHEKAILLPLLPALLMLCKSSSFPVMFGIVASISLFHLMEKNYCLPATAGLVMFWLCFVAIVEPNALQFNLNTRAKCVSWHETSQNFSKQSKSIYVFNIKLFGGQRNYQNILFRISFFSLVLLPIFLQYFVKPPMRYPYLHIYLQSTVCAILFTSFIIIKVTEHPQRTTCFLQKCNKYVLLNGFSKEIKRLN